MHASARSTFASKPLLAPVRNTDTKSGDNDDQDERERQHLGLISGKNYKTSAADQSNNLEQHPGGGSSFITRNMSTIKFGLACFVAELVGTFVLVVSCQMLIAGSAFPGEPLKLTDLCSISATEL